MTTAPRLQRAGTDAAGIHRQIPTRDVIDLRPRITDAVDVLQVPRVLNGTRHDGIAIVIGAPGGVPATAAATVTFARPLNGSARRRSRPSRPILVLVAGERNEMKPIVRLWLHARTGGIGLVVTPQYLNST